MCASGVREGSSMGAPGRMGQRASKGGELRAGCQRKVMEET